MTTGIARLTVGSILALASQISVWTMGLPQTVGILMQMHAHERNEMGMVVVRHGHMNKHGKHCHQHKAGSHTVSQRMMSSVHI